MWCYMRENVTYVHATTRGNTRVITEKDFPNCIDAVDGKQFSIRVPPHSGPQFYNYKKHISYSYLNGRKLQIYYHVRSLL